MQAKAYRVTSHRVVYDVLTLTFALATSEKLETLSEAKRFRDKLVAEYMIGNEVTSTFDASDEIMVDVYELTFNDKQRVVPKRIARTWVKPPVASKEA